METDAITDLQTLLGVECAAAKTIKKKTYKNVFMGYKIVHEDMMVDFLDPNYEDS